MQEAIDQYYLNLASLAIWALDSALMIRGKYKNQNIYRVTPINWILLGLACISNSILIAEI